MSAPTTQDMAEVARELREALAEHDRVTRLIGGNPVTGEMGAEAVWKQALLNAHAESTVMHPDRKVKEHEVAAEQAAFEQWSSYNALVYELKALKERMHSLRQVLSAFQTQARTERDTGRWEP